MVIGACWINLKWAWDKNSSIFLRIDLCEIIRSYKRKSRRKTCCITRRYLFDKSIILNKFIIITEMTHEIYE